jgi:serine/threonine protein kinase
MSEVNQWGDISAASERLDRALASGEALLIEDLLAMAPVELRPAMLEALLDVEWWHRLRNGERLRLEAFERRFPAYVENVRRAFPANIGPFSLFELIGAGGFGSVYRGRRQSDETPLAIKLLHDGADVTRLRPVVPPGPGLIVPIGPPEEYDGRTVVVSPYVEGETLGACIQSCRDRHDPLPPHRVAHIIRSIAATLVGCHGHVTHFDLSPSNVLIAGDDVFLIDFDLAQPHDLRHSHRFRRRIAGTPLYMAPEQMRLLLRHLDESDGHGAPGGRYDVVSPEQRAAAGVSLGPAVDIWALGVLCYELLTLEHPFYSPAPASKQRDTDITEPRATIDALHANVMHANLIAAHSRRPSVPLALSRICDECLRLDPRDRYRAASDVVAAFDAWQASTAPVLPGATPPAEPAAPAAGPRNVFQGPVGSVTTIDAREVTLTQHFTVGSK